MMLDAVVAAAAAAAASDISPLLSRPGNNGSVARGCTMQSNSINMSGRMKEEKPSLPYPSPLSLSPSLSLSCNEGARA